MKKSFLFLILMLPLLAVAQNKPLTQKQSKAHLKALKELSTIYEIYDYIGNDTYIAYKKDENRPRAWLVNTAGKKLLPFEFDYIDIVERCSLLSLFKDTLIGFADRSGNIIVPLIYDNSIYDGDGPIFAATRGHIVVRKDGKYGVIDTTGRVVVPLKYSGDYMYLDYKEPFIYLDSYSDGQYTEYLIRYNSDTVIIAEDVYYMSDGIIRVRKDNLYGLYDTTGREIVKCQYDVFNSIPYNGLYSVRKDGHWKLIDLKGKEHFTTALSKIDDSCFVRYSASGLIFHYSNSNSMCGAIDTNGRTVIAPDSNYTYVFYDDSERIVMTDEEDYNAYVFDIKGNLLDSYSYIDDFCCEEPLSKYITVKKNGLYGLVDSCWNLVMPFKFKNELSAVDNNHFLTDLGDGIKGLVDLNGKILFKTPFDWVFSHGNGIYSGNSYGDRKNKIVGFADIYGNTTLTKEEYATMQRWNKQREEKERIAAEKRKAQAENKSTTQQINKSTTITFDGEEEVFVVVEEPPRFPGGDSALYMYLCMNLSYPDAARENKIEGMVVVLFVVEKDGSVSNVRVLRDIGGGCGEAAVEVVKNMPRWEPGRQAGKAIRTQFSLPLKFELKSYDSTNGMSQEEKCKFLLNQRGFIK
jgi:TonB family protein